MPLSLSFPLILLLIGMNGFFVAAQYAIVKVRGSRSQTQAIDGYSRTVLASRLTSHLDAYLSACQLGITTASLGLGWLGEPAIARVIEPVFIQIGVHNEMLLHSISFMIAFVTLTALHIILGELTPKTIAIRKSELVTRLAAKPLVLFYRLMYPLIWLLNLTANQLLKSLGIEPATEKDSAHTEDEIRILMKQSHKSGLIDHTELTLVDNIFDFAETNAKEIMIPRTEMICLSTNLSFADNQTLALEQMLTRYPVCENDKDNIIGFVHIKDLLRDRSQGLHDIRQITRPITTVPESMPISTLLKLMQKRKSQISILIDEYGGTSGLVTLEDIMEEIVGEIQDEFDEEREPLERIDEHTFSISGLMLIEEVNSFFGLSIETDSYDTIGGWIYSQIDIPPSINQRIEYARDVEFIIEETDHLRIARITIRRTGALIEGSGEQKFG